MHIHAFRAVTEVQRGAVVTACVFTGASETLAADAVVLVTARLPEDGLALELERRRSVWAGAGIESLAVIGDALAPATIAHATYAGRRYAEECDAAPAGADAVPFRREITGLADLPKPPLSEHSGGLSS